MVVVAFMKKSKDRYISEVRVLYAIFEIEESKMCLLSKQSTNVLQCKQYVGMLKMVNVFQIN
jgi:hypothetical protein